MRPLFLAALLAVAQTAPAAGLAITVDNEAGVEAAELRSILRDFSAWGAKVARYHAVREPAPVTVRITRKVPFGFYRDGTVLLPPSADRWEMLDNWVHELTHHLLGRDSSFFFKEGAAVHTLEALFANARRVPATWPQFGQSTDAWVALYVARGRMPRLVDLLAWPHYLGATPDEDFRSWQVYNIAGSFCGWYIRTHGHEAFRRAFAAEWPEQDSAQAQREWLAAVAASKPASFDPRQVLPQKNPRYRAYADRLAP